MLLTRIIMYKVKISSKTRLGGLDRVSIKFGSQSYNYGRPPLFGHGYSENNSVRRWNECNEFNYIRFTCSDYPCRVVMASYFTVQTNVHFFSRLSRFFFSSLVHVSNGNRDRKKSRNTTSNAIWNTYIYVYLKTNGDIKKSVDCAGRRARETRKVAYPYRGRCRGDRAVHSRLTPHSPRHTAFALCKQPSAPNT